MWKPFTLLCDASEKFMISVKLFVVLVAQFFLFSYMYLTYGKKEKAAQWKIVYQFLHRPAFFRIIFILLSPRATTCVSVVGSLNISFMYYLVFYSLLLVVATKRDTLVALQSSGFCLQWEQSQWQRQRSFFHVHFASYKWWFFYVGNNEICFVNNIPLNLYSILFLLCSRSNVCVECRLWLLCKIYIYLLYVCYMFSVHWFADFHLRFFRQLPGIRLFSLQSEYNIL